MTDAERWALNAHVARRVFGLNIISDAWPAMRDPDGCGYMPEYHVVQEGDGWRPDDYYDLRIPVYAAVDGDWPPEWDEDVDGWYCSVRAVPDYVGDSRDCDQVEAWLCERATVTLYSPTPTIPVWEIECFPFTDERLYVEQAAATRRELFCQAALAVAEQEAGHGMIRRFRIWSSLKLDSMATWRVSRWLRLDGWVATWAMQVGDVDGAITAMLLRHARRH